MGKRGPQQGAKYGLARKRRADQQAMFLSLLKANEGQVGKTLGEMGLSRSALTNWRKDDPAFRRSADQIRTQELAKAKALAATDRIYNPKRAIPKKIPFREWRPIYTGRTVLRHQEHLVEAWLEDRTNTRVICFMPPGAGKDTTAMDMILYDAVYNRKLRQAWLMENENFSKRRISERLEPYLSDYTTYEDAPEGGTVPTRNLIDDFGPFKWEPGLLYPDGAKVPRQTWNSSELYFLPLGAPESEPNLWATGIEGTLYGARVQQMVLSDPFTRENQKNPKTQADQIEWLEGTMESRLDADGRLLLINTRVGEHDNQGKLLNKFTEGARVVKQSEDGFYTKYSNGTAVIVVPAIQVDDEGVEESYWEEAHPLDGYLVMPDGTKIYTDDLDDAELEAYSQRGAKRRNGLREFRARKRALFAAMWQQNPVTDEDAEFTDALLNHCDDMSLSIAMRKPGEVLVEGVDPARTFGAAWVMWGWNPKDDYARIVDYGFYRALGTQGIREKLLLYPVIEYWPGYLAWEVNTESAVLDHPDVIDVIADKRVNLIRHKTGNNKNIGPDAVATMTKFMRDGTIRFPAALGEDREKMELFKEHFINWDRNQRSLSPTRPGKSGHLEDDIAMAAWVGWVQVRALMRKRRRLGRRRYIPRSVAERWGQRPQTETKRGARLPVEGTPTKPFTDLEAAYHGGGYDDDAHMG